MDDHIRNPDVHLVGNRNLSRIEVHYFCLQNSLHFVHFFIVAYFDESVVNLAEVDLVCDLVSSFATQAALFVLASEKFPAMRRGIGHMKDVSEHGGGWHFHPIQLLAGIDQPIMHCFGLVSTSRSIKLVNVVDDFTGISEVLVLGDIGRLLWRMVPICDHCKSQGDSFSPHFILNLLDNSDDC